MLSLFMKSILNQYYPVTYLWSGNVAKAMYGGGLQEVLEDFHDGLQRTDPNPHYTHYQPSYIFTISIYVIFSTKCDAIC